MGSNVAAPKPAEIVFCERADVALRAFTHVHGFQATGWIWWLLTVGELAMREGMRLCLRNQLVPIRLLALKLVRPVL